MARIIAVTALLTLSTLITGSDAMDRITGKSFATRSEVLAREAMVATSQPLATQAGLEIMRKGGNALDAAIAANAVLALVEPTGCGLGGDLFAIVWDPESGRLHGLNGSGRSPRSLTLAELRDRGLERMPAYGPLPVTVPGCVDGWFELHERFGTLPMAEVLAPAIRYAREGFPVTELIAHYWQLNALNRRDQPGFAATFLPDGRAPRKGEVFRNPDLARTLEEIAAGGRDAFYEGRIAGVIADQMAAIGGFLTREDLAAHTSEWVDPVSATYRGVEVWELPPNGQGIAALQMLNVLEGFDVAGAGFGSTRHLHWFVEAKKLAFADRAAFYADPAFVDVPVAELISKAYGDRQRDRITDRAARHVPAGNPALEEGDTVYLATADGSGLMVSLIQSNYRGMGSGVCPPGLGFGLQDRGELFDLAGGRANTYAPGKRPFHTIIPAFLTRDGEPWCAFGVMGGSTQPQAHAWVVMNLVDFGMNLQEAGDAPRVVHRGSSQPTGEVMTDGGRVYLETGFAWEAVRGLEDRGHRLGTTVGGYGGYQAVMREGDVLIGASESRKDGHAAGF
ncbi:gamma-glutamyltransferase [bacterium]|nr:gamma-glutamyltransferase [bacterium]